jgi:hypothetical protein
MKNAVFWDVTPCGSFKSYVSEESIASNIRVTRICELGTTSAVTMFLRNVGTNKNHKTPDLSRQHS